MEDEIHYTLMNTAKEFTKQSNCIRAERKVAAIAARDGKIILIAANGTNDNSCATRGYCIRKKMNIESGTAPGWDWCLHAEQRLVCTAARKGISLYGTTVYVTHRPCLICTKLLSESGVAQVFFDIDYPDEMAKIYAEKNNLNIQQLMSAEMQAEADEGNAETSDTTLSESEPQEQQETPQQ